MPLPATRNHSIWSNVAISLDDGDPATHYLADQITIMRAIIAWSDQTRNAYVQAHAVVQVPTSSPVHYNFALVAVSSATDGAIEGLFDVWRGSARVVTGGVGRLYLLDQPASPPGTPPNFFKLYVGSSTSYSETWGVSGQIVQRIDYV